MTQRCRTCGETKPLEEFWRQPQAKSGRQTECRTCMAERNEVWRRANRIQARENSLKATRKDRQRNPIAALLRSVRHRAKQEGREFSLTIADIKIPEICPVLGMQLSFGLGWGEGRDASVRDSRASIDRIDNSKGYTPDNIVIVSYRANRIKSDATAVELLSVARFYNDEGCIRAAQRYVCQAEKLQHGAPSSDLSAVFHAS